jgi:heme/copper-type cytochrome/quinol oxidase subunit 2
MNHLKAMLLKEYILYKRNIVINISSILLPVIVFIVLAIIRFSISKGIKSYPHQLDGRTAVIMPFPNSKLMGLTNDSKL